MFCLCRGCPNSTSGVRGEVPGLLADPGGGGEGGGAPRAVPGPGHATLAPDTQHRHHDGHL